MISKERFKKLAGLPLKEEEVLKEETRMFGITSPGVLGNPFGNRKEVKYNLEGILDNVSSAPELDPEKVDVEEDHEGCMARGQLEQITHQAGQLLEKLPKDAELEAWVQSKLTLAAEMIDVVTHYLQDEEGDDQ